MVMQSSHQLQHQHQHYHRGYSKEENDRHVGRWLWCFGLALHCNDYESGANLFDWRHSNVFWRDLISFTWNIATFEGKEQIREAFLNTNKNKPRHGSFQIVEDRPRVRSDFYECHFTFENDIFYCRGFVRLNPYSSKAVTLLTSAMELKKHREVSGKYKTRPHGALAGVYGVPQAWSTTQGTRHFGGRNYENDSLNLKELYNKEMADFKSQKANPDVIIIGGGQSGIILAARLRRLGVSHLVLDKNENAGDGWRNRYEGLCLHDQIWYNHLPYINFPDHYPVYLPKDMVGDWLEFYTKVMHINYWSQTECGHAKFDENAKMWEVSVVTGAHEEKILKCKHVVLATGISGMPNNPQFAEQNCFQGLITHSSQYKGDKDVSGKKVVVVGSSNSAHDIAANLYKGGAQVTMIQRSSTCVVNQDTFYKTLIEPFYNEDVIRNEHDVMCADLEFSSLPYKMLAKAHKAAVKRQKVSDGKVHGGLALVGFKVNYGEDESGLFMKYLRDGGGYYINDGASNLLSQEKILLESGYEISKVKTNGVVLDNGQFVEADMIIKATGYSNMNTRLKKLFGEEIAEKVGSIWGLEKTTKHEISRQNGELRNMWKPTAQENLWIQGGNFYQNRQYSLSLALQLKARIEGLPTPVYP